MFLSIPCSRNCISFWNELLSLIRSPLWQPGFRQQLTCSVLWLYFGSLQSPKERRPLQIRVSVSWLFVFDWMSFCMWRWFLFRDFSHAVWKRHFVNCSTIHSLNLCTQAGFRDQCFESIWLAAPLSLRQGVAGVGCSKWRTLKRQMHE